MVDNALEDLDHLSQQIRKSKDTSKDPEVLQQIIIMKWLKRQIMMILDMVC